MRRKECEELILKKLKEIYKIYHEYNPQGEYLTLCIMKGRQGWSLWANNRYYGEDKNKPIDFTNYPEGENDNEII